MKQFLNFLISSRPLSGEFLNFMQFSFLTSPKQHRLLLLLLGLGAVMIVINPITSLDILLVATILFIIGEIYLKERLLLVFLALRPAIDFLRDYSLFTYRDTDINVNAAMSALLCAWGLWYMFLYRKKLYALPAKKIFAVVVALMGVSIVSSVSPITSAVETMKFLNIALLFSLSFLFVKQQIITIKEMILAIVLSAILPILVGILQLVFGTGLTTFTVLHRLYGTLGHPNVFGFFLVSLLILHTHFGIVDPQRYAKNKFILCGIYALIGILLFLTYARAAWIGFVIFLVVVGLMQYRRMLGILILSIAGFYLIFFPLNTLIKQMTQRSLTEISLVARLTSRDEDTDSIAWRKNVFLKSLPLVYARPLFGYGYGTYPFVWEDVRSNAHLFDDSAEAHNDYLRIAVELGLVGLISYVLLFATLLMSAVREMNAHKEYPKTHLHLISWIILFGIVSVSDNMLSHTPVLWLTFAWWGAIFAVNYTRSKSPNFLLH